MVEPLAINLRAESSRSIAAYSDHEMHIQIGDICCCIGCKDKPVFDSLRELYVDFLSSGPPGYRMEINTVDRLTTAEIEVALPTIGLIRNGNCFKANSLTLEGEFDRVAEGGILDNSGASGRFMALRGKIDRRTC